MTTTESHSRKNIASQCVLLFAIALFAALSPSNAAAQKAKAQRPLAHAQPAMELIVLGSGGPRATGRGETSYIVSIAGVPRILVDAGSGAFVEIGLPCRRAIRRITRSM